MWKRAALYGQTLAAGTGLLRNPRFMAVKRV
jgi:hypothetical protein